MAIEKRRAFVEFVSKDVVRITTSTRNKQFDVGKLKAFDQNSMDDIGDIIDLRDLKIKSSSIIPPPDFFAYITLIDPTDAFRGKLVSVAVKTAKDRYSILRHLNLGQSHLFDVKVVV